MFSIKTSPASFGARIAAFAFETILIAGYLIIIVIAGLLANTYLPASTHKLFGDPLSGEISGFWSITLPVSLYFILSETSAWQATWGKRRMALKVTRLDGRRLSFSRAATRTLLKFIPWELAHACIWQINFAQEATLPLIKMGFVLVWVLVGVNILCLWLSPSHQTLYDWLSGTCVVRR